ncbi:MAG: chloride channel protein [Paludibacter sp.]|nr:chloride channel protein [Bacteroidales bacterium]MCM1068631.1 chloride channel protein [Prevotella sp.]MCM1353295.1 chloride channel protein [Bacteroides sp.]MCM1442297.1 chloride channel protein [Muribaculum sp.]MCM1481116.1 chloride channel protein [Paludibacter sp.]
MVKGSEIYNRMIRWREDHIQERHFVLILSFVVGFFVSLAALLLKTLIHLLQHFIESNIIETGHTLWYLVCPTIGIALSALFVKYIVRDDISHGITKILYAISQRKSIIKVHNMWSSIVGSSLTIGFGGSVGAEAPIVLTGAAIGSNLAKLFRLDQKTMMLMIGCGAAGAVGGIFKAPIAGLVFTLEVLMIDLTMASVSPLIISSITATAFTYLFSGTVPMFPLDVIEPFALERIPWFMLLGVVCGLMSLYFTRGMNYLESRFKRVQSVYAKILIGGCTLGVLIFMFPPLYGEGYNTISALLNGHSDITLERSPIALLGNNGWVLMGYMLLIVLLKIVASVATNGGGGVGGIFAPSLFVGCITGFMVARLLNLAGMNVPEANFALAGMAGLMSGVMHAPLTGMFLIAELTGGYHLFMPLMVVSVLAYVTIMLFEPHSLYAMRLARKGELLTHNKDRSVLTLLKMDDVLETDLPPLAPEITLGELVKVISKSKRNTFPVIDKGGKLMGILLLDEVRNIMFQPRLYDRFTVSQLMTSPPALLEYGMPMERVMEIFEDTGAWNLPVVDNEKRYMGFVSKSKIFNSYRHVLVHFSEE